MRVHDRVADVHADGVAAVRPLDVAEPGRRDLERLVPRGRLEDAVLADERRGEALRRVLAVEVVIGAVAEEAAGDRVRGVAAEAGDAARVVDGAGSTRPVTAPWADRPTAFDRRMAARGEQG